MVVNTIWSPNQVKTEKVTEPFNNVEHWL